MRNLDMRIYLLRPLALVLLPLFVACSTAPAEPTTTMTHDRQFNFAGVHKIYIEPSSRTDAATIMVSDAQIKRIDSALAEELTRKGFSMVTSSQQADLFANWYLITKDPVKVKGSDCDGCDMTVDGGKRYSKGTLIVDMIDPMRNQPVWRSVLKTSLTGDPGAASAEQARREAAAAIFASFPPQ
jgi:hypothetical protein